MGRQKNLPKPTVDLENLPLDRIRDSGWWWRFRRFSAM
jgi:hypothetical protein